jgi:hypothetical protein
MTQTRQSLLNTSAATVGFSNLGVWWGHFGVLQLGDSDASRVLADEAHTVPYAERDAGTVSTQTRIICIISA